jgi:hypothetical protein
MASYIRPTDPSVFNTVPFQPPLELLGRAASFKQSKYDRGVGQIQAQANNLLNLEVSNNNVKGRLDSYNEDIKKQLQKASSLDYSIDANVNQTSQIFEPAYSDPYIMYDAAETIKAKKYAGDAETARTKDGGKTWSETNYKDFMYSFQDFKNASLEELPSKQVRPYQPYFDYKDDIAKKIKDANITVKEDTPTGRYIVTTEGGQQAYPNYRAFVRSFIDERGLNQIDIESRVRFRDASQAKAFQEGLRIEDAERNLSIDAYDSYIKDLDKNITKSKGKLGELVKQLELKESIPQQNRNVWENDEIEKLKSNKDLLQSSISQDEALRKDMTPNAGADMARFKANAGRNLYNQLYRDNVLDALAQGAAATKQVTSYKEDQYGLEEFKAHLDSLKPKKGKDDKEDEPNTPTLPNPIGETALPVVKDNMYSVLVQAKTQARRDLYGLVLGVGNNLTKDTGVTDLATRLNNVKDKRQSISKLLSTNPEFSTDRMKKAVAKAFGTDNFQDFEVEDLLTKITERAKSYLKEGINLTGDKELNDFFVQYKLLAQQESLLNDTEADVRTKYNASGLQVDKSFAQIVGGKHLTSEGEFLSKSDFIKKAVSSKDFQEYEKAKKIIADASSDKVGSALSIGSEGADSQTAIARAVINKIEKKWGATYDENMPKVIDNFNSLTTTELSERGIKFGQFRYNNSDNKQKDEVAQIAPQIINAAEQNKDYLFDKSKELSTDVVTFLKNLPQEAYTYVDFTEIAKGTNFYTLRFDPAKLQLQAGYKELEGKRKKEIDIVLNYGLQVRNAPVSNPVVSGHNTLVNSLLSGGKTIDLDLTSKFGNTPVPFKYSIGYQDTPTNGRQLVVNYEFPTFVKEKDGRLIYDPQSRFYKWQVHKSSEIIEKQSTEQAISTINSVLAEMRTKWGKYTSNKAMSAPSKTEEELIKLISQ